MDSRKKHLRAQLAAALAMDHQALPKTKKEDYAGYWIMRASEDLNPGAYIRLLRDFDINKFDAHAYRFLFMLDVLSIYAKEQEDKQP